MNYLKKLIKIMENYLIFMTMIKNLFYNLLKIFIKNIETLYYINLEMKILKKFL